MTRLWHIYSPMNYSNCMPWSFGMHDTMCELFTYSSHGSDWILRADIPRITIRNANTICCRCMRTKEWISTYVNDVLSPMNRAANTLSHMLPVCYANRYVDTQ